MELMSHQRFYKIFMIMIALSPVIGVLAPRALSFWPLLIGVITCGLWHFSLKEKLKFPKTYIYGLLGFIGISTVCMPFAFNPMESLDSCLKIWGLGILAVPFFAVCKTIDANKMRPYGYYLTFGILFGTALTAFDLSSNLALYKLSHPDALPHLNAFVLNRGLVILSLLYFFALYFTDSSTLNDKNKFRLNALMTAALFITGIFSESQSSPAAMLIGLCIYALAPYRFKFTSYILAILLSAGILLAPFIATKMFELLLENPDSLTWLAKAYPYNRMEIWDFIGRAALQSPIYGHGIEATREMHFDHAMLYHHTDTILHPHNIFLQIWLELGLIGILPLCAVLSAFILHLRKLGSERQKIMLAAFISFIGTASISYGIWQSWWIGLEILLLGLFLASRFDQDRSQATT